MQSERPARQILPHGLPAWVENGAHFFITICGATRGENQFCNDQNGLKLIESARLYHEIGKWHLNLFILMPDHIHAIMSFPREGSFKKIISTWKGYHAKHSAIRWQRDFFDHRLRNDENYEEKAAYIRQNPVRAGLVKRAEEWPYVWSG